MSIAGQSNFIWNGSTGGANALQKSGLGLTDRLAATWYTGSTETFDVKISDGKSHQVALYVLDWDHGGNRSERIDVIDDASGTVLDTESVTGFQNGKYLVWSVGGSVTFRVTNLASGYNAVVSGLFFDPSTSTSPPPPPTPTGSASFVKTDTTTQGTWKGTYGGDGWDLSQDGSANNPSLPAYRR